MPGANKGKAKGDYRDFIIKVISGPMLGIEFPLKKPVVTLGRSVEADISLNDKLISRIHSQLAYENGKWFLSDMNSTNGTWMLGQKIFKKVNLPLKTSVRTGNTVFELFNIFNINDTVSFQSPFISVSIQPETLAPSKEPGIKTGEKYQVAKEENKRLSAIYKFQNLIATDLSEEKLYPRILSSIFDVISADRAFLLVYNLENGNFVPVAERTKSGAVTQIDENEISKTIVNFVKENKESVLSFDNFDDIRKEVSNLPKLNKSVMCVPMLGNQQLNGMIYLTLASTTDKYTEDDLRLLTVLGHTAGMALENIRLLEFNLKNERLVSTGATAAGLSHYIKNILAGLDGSLNLLRMGIDENDMGLANESLNILSKNHRRLGNMVLDLLNLTSEQKLNLKIQDLASVIKDVTELMYPQLKQEGIDIQVGEAIRNVPFLAEFDATGMHRVLLNLFNNSEDAILSKRETVDQENKGMISVDARFDDTKEYIIVTVTDNGVGLKQEIANSIFDLFVTSKGMGGTGLGLAVSKRIVESHGGTITASGEPGKGCVIAFSIPINHTTESMTITHAITRISYE